MARHSVRGTPYTHIGPGQTTGEGIAPGTPKGSDGQTTMRQFRGTGMDTAQSTRGTPYNSGAGNPDQAKRTVSSDQYGRVIDAVAGDQGSHLSNGTGVLFDGATDVDNGYMPAAAAALDSPVPSDKPIFDPADVMTENRAHLGKGTGPTAPSDAMVRGNLIEIGGVMSRGMKGTSTSGGSETELIDDDTLPGVPAAGKV